MNILLLLDLIFFLQKNIGKKKRFVGVEWKVCPLCEIKSNKP